MMASMPSPAPQSAPQPMSQQGSEQKTMIAGMGAPVLPTPQPQQTSQKTVGLPAAQAAANSLPNLGAGTQILPDSQGVVAFAREQARIARENAAPAAEPPAPAGALFWLAWVVIGLGAGLGLHFFGVTSKFGH